MPARRARRGERREERRASPHGGLDAHRRDVHARERPRSQGHAHDDGSCSRASGSPRRSRAACLAIDASRISSFEAPYDLVRTMRASIYAFGPLVARFGKARVSMPGGCAWGPRPVDLHLKGLAALGAKLTIEHGYINASAGKLRGAEITLGIASVGATVNIIMAAVLAEGRTVIENAAREPEVAELARALKGGGAKIEGEGTSRVTIDGVAGDRALRAPRHSRPHRGGHLRRRRGDYGRPHRDNEVRSLPSRRGHREARGMRRPDRDRGRRDDGDGPRAAQPRERGDGILSVVSDRHAGPDHGGALDRAGNEHRRRPRLSRPFHARARALQVRREDRRATATSRSSPASKSSRGRP